MNISKGQAFDIGRMFALQFHLCHDSRDIIHKLKFSSLAPEFAVIADKLDPQEVLTVTRGKAYTLIRKVLMGDDEEDCVKCSTCIGRGNGWGVYAPLVWFVSD